MLVPVSSPRFDYSPIFFALRYLLFELSSLLFSVSFPPCSLSSVFSGILDLPFDSILFGQSLRRRNSLLSGFGSPLVEATIDRGNHGLRVAGWLAEFQDGVITNGWFCFHILLTLFDRQSELLQRKRFDAQDKANQSSLKLCILIEQDTSNRKETDRYY